MIKDDIKNLINKALTEINLPLVDLGLHHPELVFGDYSTSVAMVLAKKIGRNPKDLAEEIKNKILELKDENIRDIQIAGQGFINFYLIDKYFAQSLNKILIAGDSFGRTKILAGQKVMIEFTDPNPFKEFHIGHLMSNTIGEALARIIAGNGAEVKRACYQGDVGLHVAKTLWGMFKLESELPSEEAPISEKIKFLGKTYALGAAENEGGSESAKEGIAIINKKIYKRSDPKLNEFYDRKRSGRNVKI